MSNNTDQDKSGWPFGENVGVDSAKTHERVAPAGGGQPPASKSAPSGESISREDSERLAEVSRQRAAELAHRAPRRSASVWRVMFWLVVLLAIAGAGLNYYYQPDLSRYSDMLWIGTAVFEAAIDGGKYVLGDAFDGLLERVQEFVPLTWSSLPSLPSLPSGWELPADWQAQFMLYQWWIIGAAGLLVLFVITRIFKRSARRQRAPDARRPASSAAPSQSSTSRPLPKTSARAYVGSAAQTSALNDATAKAINIAVAEMRRLLNGMQVVPGEAGKNPIAQWQAHNDQQMSEISSVAQEVVAMAKTIVRLSESASKSTEWVRANVEVAKKGVVAASNAITDMIDTRKQIEDNAAQLKQLEGSTARIDEIVEHFQETIEQTNVLSLNVSVQAAMSGKVGHKFAAMVKEAQRLSERSARETVEITELVQHIQRDVHNAIASMETTAKGLHAGTSKADEAVVVLGEIESTSAELLTKIDQISNEVVNETTMAQRIGERMGKLKSAIQQSGTAVSRIAVGIEKLKSITQKMDKSLAAFKRGRQ